MRGGGIKPSLLSKKANRSTELGLHHFCCYGLMAHCNTIIYTQEISRLLKNGSRGLNKLPLLLKDNGFNLPLSWQGSHPVIG